MAEYPQESPVVIPGPVPAPYGPQFDSHGNTLVDVSNMPLVFLMSGTTVVTEQPVENSFCAAYAGISLVASGVSGATGGYLILNASNCARTVKIQRIDFSCTAVNTSTILQVHITKISGVTASGVINSSALLSFQPEPLDWTNPTSPTAVAGYFPSGTTTAMSDAQHVYHTMYNAIAAATTGTIQQLSVDFAQNRYLARPTFLPNTPNQALVVMVSSASGGAVTTTNLTPLAMIYWTEEP